MYWAGKCWGLASKVHSATTAEAWWAPVPGSLGRRRQAPALPAPSQADNGEGAAAHVAAPAAPGGAMHAPAAAGTAGAATEEDVAMVLLPSEGIVKYR